MAFRFCPGGREKTGPPLGPVCKREQVCFTLRKTIDSQISALGLQCPLETCLGRGYRSGSGVFIEDLLSGVGL